MILKKETIIRTILVFILFVFALSGCATTANYEKKLNTWIGVDAKELIAQVGYPDSSIQVPNGNMIYVYKSFGYVTMPTTGNTTTFGTGYSITTINPGQTIWSYCNTYFEIGPDGKILKWSWEGNNCVSYGEAMEKELNDPDNVEALEKPSSEPGTVGDFIK